MGDSYREALKKTQKRVPAAKHAESHYWEAAAKRAAIRKQHSRVARPEYSARYPRQVRMF